MIVRVCGFCGTAWGLCLLTQQIELLCQELSHQSRQRFPALPRAGNPPLTRGRGAGASRLPPASSTRFDFSCLNTQTAFFS